MFHISINSTVITYEVFSEKLILRFNKSHSIDYDEIVTLTKLIIQINGIITERIVIFEWFY